MSSTYRFHRRGLEGADSRASSSKNSMYRLATTTGVRVRVITGYRLAPAVRLASAARVAPAARLAPAAIQAPAAID